MNELAWIHGCVLLNVVYDASSDAGRIVKWSIRCSEDVDYTPWQGRDLVLIAVDVAMLKHIAWGVAGRETINAIRPGVSDAAQESAMDAREAGVRFPDIEFTMDMHSGSSVEVICSKLEIGTHEIQRNDFAVTRSE